MYVLIGMVIFMALCYLWEKNERKVLKGRDLPYSPILGVLLLLVTGHLFLVGILPRDIAMLDLILLTLIRMRIVRKSVKEVAEC
jgi:hypothetical protein